MMRRWSIRARTALIFAVAAMALAAGAIVFSNLMSQAGVGRFYSTGAREVRAEGGERFVLPTPSASPVFRPGTTDPDWSTTVSVVDVVASQQWQWSAIGTAGAGVLAGALGWLVSRRMLRPIDRIAETANRITASNLHERIALDGPDDELRRLSRTVDDLLDRLEAAFASQRRFIAQASHELRTPLAVQRAAMQIGLHDDAASGEVQAVREQLLEQNRRTEHLVESLLVLAEADRGLSGDVEDVDLGSLAERVVAEAGAAARDAGVALAHEILPESRSCVVRGEPVLLRQLLVNLVGNAIEYNEPGGFVRVITRDKWLVVENSGAVVAPDLAPLLVEAFRRCPDAPGGGRHSGLGLSIVASIVQAHGWRLDVAARPEGGLRVDVSVV